jgi:uroporphyrinogen-III synthase
LSQRLTQWGAKISWLPLIEVRSIPFQLEQETAYDWLFFTSQNAVHAFFQSCPDGWNDAAIAVVGPATGEALAIYNKQAAFTALQFDAESAAQAFCETHACQGLRILWPCGNLANQCLQDILQAAGAQVLPLVVYETGLRQTFSPQESGLWIDGVDVVVLASPSAVNAFHHLSQSLSLNWQSMAIACLGPKTAEVARTCLGRLDIQPENASIPALAEAIRAYYQSRETGS